MDIFRTHAQIVDDYATYIRSFIKISDDQIRAEVERELEKGKLWPQPLLQFNPSFEMFGRMDDLTAKGYRDEETDTQVGIHSKLLALLQREQWAAAGMFCREFRSLLVSSELHADGVAVKAGPTWRRANQRRDVRRTEDE